MLRTFAACLVAVVLSPVPASAATPDTILRDLAANQTHSWVDNGLSFEAMEAKYHSGQRLYVTCGNVAEVGRRLLRSAGYNARVVQSITRETFDYVNDGHLLLEVLVGDRWELYDVDANARAVDANGRGISLMEQVTAVQTGTAHWEMIATDPLWNENDPNTFGVSIARDIFTNPEPFYRRVMGIPLLPAADDGRIAFGTFFWDGQQRWRLWAYTGGSTRHLATDAKWSYLTKLPVSALTDLYWRSYN
jgi:hypothetical protein